jgi:hypothetical protein
MVLILGAFAATSAATAQQSTTPRLSSPPFLGRISGGAAVRYTLTRTPASQTVTIAGHPATVKETDKTTREFTALVHIAGFKAGRSYRVQIVAIARGGRTKLTYRHTRFLHRSMNVPQSS